MGFTRHELQTLQFWRKHWPGRPKSKAVFDVMLFHPKWFAVTSKALRVFPMAEVCQPEVENRRSMFQGEPPCQVRSPEMKDTYSVGGWPMTSPCYGRAILTLVASMPPLRVVPRTRGSIIVFTQSLLPQDEAHIAEKLAIMPTV